jgi:hypothetical protein
MSDLLFEKGLSPTYWPPTVICDCSVSSLNKCETYPTGGVSTFSMRINTNMI